MAESEAQHHGNTASSSHSPPHHLYHHHHHHHHITRHRVPSGPDDSAEEEELDPRIQIELERLNKASEEINKLELELDDARAGFRQVLSDSTQCLNGLAKKLGACVDKARPYYDGRMRLKEAHVESQKAALRFERACSMHEAAKEMVQLAEEGYKRREEDLDPTWQEMLNHATMKVNDAEKERIESESYHQQTTISFKKREEDVQKLQKDLKRSITKSRPYFEMKAKFNQVMEEQKSIVSRLEESVSQAKALYSQALRNLEAISDDIHRTRLERRQKKELGERGPGVGAEAPSPPPSWDKGINIEGSASSCAFDSDGDEDSAQTFSLTKMDSRGIIRHEPALHKKSSVSESFIESGSLEADPLNVVVFKTDPPLSNSSSPKRTLPSFQPPSVIHPHPDRARNASYRMAVENEERGSVLVSRSEIDREVNAHDITPTPENISTFHLVSSSPPRPDAKQSLLSYQGKSESLSHRHQSNSQHPHQIPESPRSTADLSLAQSSLSRAQEWVNRSPVPQQRRFVKSKSLINSASVSAQSSSSASSSPRDGEEQAESEGEPSQRGLSSSLTTEALRGMRAGQHIQPAHTSNIERTLSSPASGYPLVNAVQQPLSVPASICNPASHQLKSSSLGSVRSVGSTPPDHPSSSSVGSGSSPTMHRKSPKLQGLILKVDPSGGSGSGVGLGRPTLSSSPRESTPPLPRVVISTQHPTLGVFTEQRERQQKEDVPLSSSDQQQKFGGAPQLSLSSSPSPSDAATDSVASGIGNPPPPSSSSSSPSAQIPTSTSPRQHPTSLITQQLNKMMQAVGASASVTSKVSNYNSKTAPSTLMGNSYRLPTSSSNPKPLSPMPNTETPVSPTDRCPRSDSLSTVGSSSIHSRGVHLKPPSDSSDTESIASTGPMLDDDQVELINMDFTEQSIANLEDQGSEEDCDYPAIDPNLVNPRGHWSRMSLPPRLNYLEGFLDRARKLSGEPKTAASNEDGAEKTAGEEEGGALPLDDEDLRGLHDGCTVVVDVKSGDTDEIFQGVSEQRARAGAEQSGKDSVSAVESTEDGRDTMKKTDSALGEEDNSTDDVCTEIQATVVISPDQGISILEESTEAFEPEEDEGGQELVTKEDHYL